MEGTLRFLATTVLALTVLGCVVDRGPMDQRHAERAAKINAQYDAEVAESDQHWDALIAHAKRYEINLIDIDPGSNYLPRPLTFDAHEALFRVCAAEEQPEEEERCRNEASGGYLKHLHTRFHLADHKWARDEYLQTREAAPSVGVEHLEALMAFSHNQAVYQHVATRTAEWTHYKEEARRQIQESRDAELNLSADQRDGEIALAVYARQRQAAAVGAAFQRAGQAMQSPAQTTATLPGPGCTSDFACGIGNVCVKANYSSSGYCARAVNQHGTPTYNSPNSRSVGAKMPSSTDCKGVLDCPTGFTCDVRSGACLRAQ